MMEQVLDVPQPGRHHQGQRLGAGGRHRLHPGDGRRGRRPTGWTNLDFAITQLTMTNLRTVVGSMELDEVLSQRDQINTRLLDVIDQATSPWGVKVARIEIKDLQPPPDITNAMARQMKAERERRAVITEADGEKQAADHPRRGRQAVGHPAGRGPRRPPSATPRRASAPPQAEAKATELVSDAIAKGDVNAINYFIAQKYVEAFAKLAESPQQKTVIVPAEMAGWWAPSPASPSW